MAASPHESLESLRVHDHAALFHRGEKERVETLVPFLRIGLARREKCLLHCGKAAAAAILSSARAGGIDIGNALARGSILVAPSAAPAERKTAPFDPEALVSFLRSAALQARTERYSALRICLDVAHALGRERRRDRILELQGKLHAFLESHDALSLCMHDTGNLPPEILLDALRAHPLVVHDGRRIENFHFVHPSADPREKTHAREFAERMEHLLERQERNMRVRRQAARLLRFRGIASSLLAHAAVPDLMDAIVEGVISLGYRMCWIGMARPDGTVEVVASWGDKMGYLQEIQVRWDDTPLGNGPVGRAIRKGTPDVIREVALSRRFAPWRESALARGFLSVAAVPLTAEGRTAGALAVYSPARNAFDKEAIEELSAFAVHASLALQYGKEYRTLALSEERFRTVVEEINVVVVELDPEGRIVLFNPAAERLAGYAADEVIGKDCFGLLVPEAARGRAREVFREVLGGREVEGYESPVLRKDGTERIVSWNTKAIRAGDGEPRAVVGLGMDVTERLRMEEERERLRRSLVQAQKMEAVGALAGGIAHDFNNMLGAVLGHASYLRTRMDPGSPFLDTVRKIEEAAERAAGLTTQLLGFARAGKHQVRAVSLNDIARDVGSVVSRSFGGAIEVRSRLEPELHPVEGDPGQLEQCLLHLCFNARDAMPSGGILTIATENLRLSEEEARRFHVGRAGDCAVLTVTDTGEGMTEEVRSRVFEPFFSTRKGEAHSGMGLPMVYGVVKNHAGGIEVDSAPGRGSTFRILLPSRPDAEAQTRPPPEETFPGGAETILVVDDEHAIRDMATELLTALGYRVLTAEDGADACRQFRERGGEIGLVLLDLVMPRMGGKETFRALREIDPAVPVLLSSGYALEGLAQEILDEGADGFIQKPYRMSQIGRALREILDSPRRRGPS